MSYPVDVNDIQHDLKIWTEKTFPQRTMGSILAHLRSEIAEIEENPDDIMEFADAFMLLFDAVSYQGFHMSEVYRAMDRKLEINKARKWGRPNAEGFVEHIKESSCQP